MPAFFAMFLDEWNGPVAITINRERMPRIHQRPLVHLTLDVPTLAGPHAAVAAGHAGADRNSDAEGLAGRFAIPGGMIVAAAHAAEAGRMPDRTARRRDRSRLRGRRTAPPADLAARQEAADAVRPRRSDRRRRYSRRARRDRRGRDASAARSAISSSCAAPPASRCCSPVTPASASRCPAPCSRSASASTSTRSICRRSCRSGSARPRRTSATCSMPPSPATSCCCSTRPTRCSASARPTSSRATIATRTWRPTISCSASSASTASRS